MLIWNKRKKAINDLPFKLVSQSHILIIIYTILIADLRSERPAFSSNVDDDLVACQKAFDGLGEAAYNCLSVVLNMSDYTKSWSLWY